MGEEQEQTLTVSNLVDLGGAELTGVPVGKLDIDDDAIISENPFGESPDREEYEGYMGNVGNFSQRTCPS